MRVKILIAAIATSTFGFSAETFAGSCSNLLIFRQAFEAKILNSENYARQQRNELSARLGRPQEFIARKKIDPQNLVLERRFTENGERLRTELILGTFNAQRVLIKIFWQSAENLDSDIDGAIIQDFLAEMELAPKIFGIVLDSEKISNLKEFRSLPHLADRSVRSGLYMAIIMEYIPQSFNVPYGRFMPPWYVTADPDEISRRITHTETVLERLGIERDPLSEYLITENGRAYALNFDSDSFNSDFIPELSRPGANHHNHPGPLTVR